MKIKVPKARQKWRYKNIKVVLCKKKKRLETTPFYSKNDTISKRGKNGHFAEAIVRQNAQKWPYFQFFDFDLSFKLQSGL